MKEGIGFKTYLSVLRLSLSLSTVIILATIFLGVSNLERLSSFCICKINYLAYSWIAFAITILLSLAGFFLISVGNSAEKKLSMSEKINFILIIAGFVCGIILLIVFAAYILNIL